MIQTLFLRLEIDLLLLLEVKRMKGKELLQETRSFETQRRVEAQEVEANWKQPSLLKVILSTDAIEVL